MSIIHSSMDCVIVVLGLCFFGSNLFRCIDFVEFVNSTEFGVGNIDTKIS